LIGPSKWGFKVILKVGAKIFGGNYIRPQNCAFSDIFGPDLTRRAVAFCVGIAICHRKILASMGSTAPLPELAGNLRCRKAPRLTFDYQIKKSESFCDVTAGL